MLARAVLEHHRVRHLERVSIRNLVLSSHPDKRARSGTNTQPADDDALPSTHASPSKLQVRRETLKLEHSRSSSDLKSIGALAGASKGKSKDLAGESEESDRLEMSKRKVKAKPRRRSTVNWAYETPTARQKILEGAVVEKRIDSFFSLHFPAKNGGVDGEQDHSHGSPFYISETCEQTMNPDFDAFQIHERPGISVLDEFQVRVWAKQHPEEGTSGQFVLLLEQDIKLDSLIFLGKSTSDIGFPLMWNTLLFQLVDGVYAVPSSVPPSSPIAASHRPSASRTSTLPDQPRPTSSYDALMQLKTHQECIDDAFHTRDTVIQQIEALIDDNNRRLDQMAAVQQARARQQNAADAVNGVKREIKKLKAQVAIAETDLETRKQRVRAGVDDLAEGQAELKDVSRPDAELNRKLKSEKEAEARGSSNELGSDAEAIRARHADIKTAIAGQTRRIAEHLLTIFPIDPIPDQPLCFTIAGLPLPNAGAFGPQRNHHRHGSGASLTGRASSPVRPLPKAPPPDDDETAAALGYVAQIVLLLSTLLYVPLAYQILPKGSSSAVFDPLTPAEQLGPAAVLPSSPASPNSATVETPTPENSPWRVFTLSPKATSSRSSGSSGQGAARFAWAVYLLNKCLEEVMSACGLKVVDPRNTLPNLKYALTVMASGKGEVPGRKAGWVSYLDERRGSRGQEEMGSGQNGRVN